MLCPFNPLGVEDCECVHGTKLIYYFSKLLHTGPMTQHHPLLLKSSLLCPLSSLAIVQHFRSRRQSMCAWNTVHLLPNRQFLFHIGPMTQHHSPPLKSSMLCPCGCLAVEDCECVHGTKLFAAKQMILSLLPTAPMTQHYHALLKSSIICLVYVSF